MTKTEQEFLSTLQAFRLGMRGSKIDMNKVFESFARYICDRTNDVLVYANRNNNIILQNDGNETVALLYTSFDEAYKALFNGKNIDVVVNSAYNIFKDLSSSETCTGVLINNGTTPTVFVPKEIMKKLVEVVDIVKAKTIN